MKRTLLVVLISSLFVIGSQTILAQPYDVPTNYATIQLAINAAPGGSTINIAAGTYAGAVVNKNLTLIGVGPTTIITNASGIGLSITANNVTIQSLTVTGCDGHGISAATVTGLNISDVFADGNGLGVGGGSGIALRNVTGVSNVTNVSAQNNKKHGLEIGNGSKDIVVTGGTFSGNGVAGDESTGGGIILYSDDIGLSNEVTDIKFHGALTASNNKTAGIYVYSTPGKVNGTSIGQLELDNIQLADNGSSTVQKAGGAGVLLFGLANGTLIKANFSRTTVPSGAIVILGVDAAGTNPPTFTTIANCTFTGYDGNYRIVIFDTDDGSLKADPGTANVIPTGTGSTPPFVVYVMAGGDGTTGETFATAKATINAGIAAAGNGTTVYVNDPTNTVRSTETVNVNKKIFVASNGPSNTILHKMVTISSSDVRVTGLRVTTSTSHGFWANGVANLVMENVQADANAQSGIALRGVTGKSRVKSVTATNNLNHGLEIGNGSNGVNVVGGTFTGNGTAGNRGTGGGITLYADASSTVVNTVISGSVYSGNNTTAGIYIFSDPGVVSGTQIGQTSGDVIALSNNGSANGPDHGGAGVIVYGWATGTAIGRGSFSQGSETNGVGIAHVGTDGTGTHSPSTTTVSNCTFTGYSSAAPAITNDLPLTGGFGPLHSTNDVTATNNTFKFKVSTKVYLEGPYAVAGDTMRTALNWKLQLPSQHHYNLAPWGYGGTETVGSLPANVVDWVLVDLRSSYSDTAAALIQRRAALLRKDGIVLDIDGNPGVEFSENVVSGNAPGKNYFHYLVIRHRNHVAIMSKDSISTPNASPYDFTADSTKTFNFVPPNKPIKNVTGLPNGSGAIWVMWAGNADSNNLINALDRAKVKATLGSTPYNVGDANMDGIANAVDRGAVKSNLGATSTIK